MQLNRVIVIGSSLGGVAALTELVAGLPADIDAAIFIVLHVGNNRCLLPELISRRSALPVALAEDRELIAPGRVRVAPPDHHLLVEHGQLSLSRGPLENFTRPAIDPLFRSAAQSYGRSTVGVVLTGLLNDGTTGLRAIKASHGIAVVQDPVDALEASMPKSALQHVQVDYCVPLAAMPNLLTSLASRPESASCLARSTKQDHS